MGQGRTALQHPETHSWSFSIAIEDSMGVAGEFYAERKHNEPRCAWRSLELLCGVGEPRTWAAKARSINLHPQWQEQLCFSSPNLALFIKSQT